MMCTDETAGLAMLRAAFPDGRDGYHDGWTFTVTGGRWVAGSPPDCTPIWGDDDYPITAANPVELAKLCSEAETSQLITDMHEQSAAWHAAEAEREAAELEAVREAHERSWDAVFAPGSFMNPNGRTRRVGATYPGHRHPPSLTSKETTT